MSGLLETLTANADIQGAGKTALEVADAGISAIASMTGVGEVVNIAEGILSFIDPAAGSSGPSLSDIQQQLSEFTTFVTNKLNEMQKAEAAGQVQSWASKIQATSTAQGAPLPIIGELATWKNEFGLPLPDSLNPGQYQESARSALLQLIGGGPDDAWPTPFWWLPPGDLPLFQPDNPWTYAGTRQMFNVFLPGGGPTVTANFDLSALHFTNDFAPTAVAGILGGNAFCPTWILQQTMACVNYYFIICGAVLKNFPNDGSTAQDWVGTGNPTSPADFSFLSVLSWYHDQLRAGIVCISPPVSSDLVPAGPGGLIPASADEGLSPWSVPCSGNDLDGHPYPFGNDWSSDQQAAADAPFSQWKRPFGALCSYTGFVAGVGGSQPSVDSYPDYVYPNAGMDVTPPGAPFSENWASAEWNTSFYGKYLVACLWRAKLVYNGMGLDDMWHTINKLYAMFGKPPRPGPCFGDWSLREVFNMLGSADLNSFPLPPQQYVPVTGPTFRLTVRALIEFMNNAAPMPKTPLKSLRAILQA